MFCYSTNIFQNFCYFQDPKEDGSCIDVVQVQDSYQIIFETCGTIAGAKIISDTNIITVNLIGQTRIYPARGFFLQYQGLL